jgi:hypothetical protein
VRHRRRLQAVTCISRQPVGQHPPCIAAAGCGPRGPCPAIGPASGQWQMYTDGRQITDSMALHQHNRTESLTVSLTEVRHRDDQQAFRKDCLQGAETTAPSFVCHTGRPCRPRRPYEQACTVCKSTIPVAVHPSTAAVSYRS